MLTASHATLARQKRHTGDVSVRYLKHNQKGILDISLLLQ